MSLSASSLFLLGSLIYVVVKNVTNTKRESITNPFDLTQTDVRDSNNFAKESKQVESVKENIQSNAQATSPSPMPPDDDPNNDDDFDKNNNSGNNKKYREKTRNANANDRKQVDSIAKKFNLNRREFGDFIEDTKQSMGRKPSDNFSYQELEILAKEFMELQ